LLSNLRQSCTAVWEGRHSALLVPALLWAVLLGWAAHYCCSAAVIFGAHFCVECTDGTASTAASEQGVLAERSLATLQLLSSVPRHALCLSCCVLCCVGSICCKQGRMSGGTLPLKLQLLRGAHVVLTLCCGVMLLLLAARCTTAARMTPTAHTALAPSVGRVTHRATLRLVSCMRLLLVVLSLQQGAVVMPGWPLD
jgi:hypothetical protein